jgi:carbon-monoxide dehydrogenase medium subunit
MPCVAVTLEAELVVAGPAGRRTIAAEDFFISHFTTVLEPDEVLVEARFPRQGKGRGWSFLEFSRKTGDFAVAAVAVDLPLGQPGGPARIGVAGVGERPWRATEAESVLGGERPTADAVREAAVQAGRQALALTEGHPDGPYRAHVVETLVSRAVSEAVQRTGER